MQLMVSSVCMLLTATVVGNAYYQKRQFYPAVVYITKSNASMAVIYIQFFVIVFMCGKLLRKIFLGTLRAAEFEHLLERFWYALTETCLAFTVFRDDFNPRFVALFTVLLFLKSFHWLSEERVDYMERSPVISWLFHIRVVSLLTVLGVLDYMLLMHAYNSTLMRGPTVQLVFGFEYAILLTMVANTAIKYVLHTAEMRTDAPWENKAIFLLYTELVIGLIKVVLYVLFVIIMAKIYALPMFVFRPMFFTIRNFKKALSDVIMSRRAIRNMNTLYPDATPEELRLSDNLCIICREEMVNSSKKLPCGHIFHTNCLRSWFQRQQTCPTCRLNILRTPATQSTALPRQDENAGTVPLVGSAAAGAGVAAATAATPHIVGATEALAGHASVTVGANPFFNMTGNLRNNPFADFQSMPIIPPPAMSHLPPAFLMPPQFPFMTPYNVPMPPMPEDLTNLSDEQMRAMEGQTRKNIEERLKLLQQITTLVNAADVLMANYRIACANSGVPFGDANNASANAASTATTIASTASATTTAAVSNDEPTTSAAAAANSQANAQTAAAVNANTTAEPNKVTLEDVGMEENELAPLLNKENSMHAEESTELSELRKRRLKFLQDKTQTSTTTTD